MLIDALFLLCCFMVPTCGLLAVLAWWFDRPRPMAIRRSHWQLRLVQRIRAVMP